LSFITDWSESGLSCFKAAMNKDHLLEPNELMEEGDIFAELIDNLSVILFSHNELN